MSIEQKLNDLLENKEAAAKVAKKLAEAGTPPVPKQELDADGNPIPGSDDPADLSAVQAVINPNPINPEAPVMYDADGNPISGNPVSGKKTVSMESIADILGDEFSEDFKLQVTTIFEAAIKVATEEAKTKLEEEFAVKETALQEKFESALVEKTKALEEDLGEKIDGYLSVIAEEWTQKNELAIDAGIKTELSESFINGMKTLFQEHYIDIPDNKIDMIANLKEEKAALETALSDSMVAVSTLSEKFNTVARENIINESSKEFTSIDFARFKALVEDFDFESEDTFRKRVSIVKKAFFENKVEKTVPVKAVSVKPLVEEKILSPEPVATAMNQYLQFLKK